MTKKKEVIYVQAQKPRGNWGWLVFWTLMCFPIAIVYYFMRSWGKEAKR